MLKIVLGFLISSIIIFCITFGFMYLATIEQRAEIVTEELVVLNISKDKFKADCIDFTVKGGVRACYSMKGRRYSDELREQFSVGDVVVITHKKGFNNTTINIKKILP